MHHPLVHPLLLQFLRIDLGHTVRTEHHQHPQQSQHHQIRGDMTPCHKMHANRDSVPPADKHPVTASEPTLTERQPHNAILHLIWFQSPSSNPPSYTKTKSFHFQILVSATKTLSEYAIHKIYQMHIVGLNSRRSFKSPCPYAMGSTSDSEGVNTAQFMGDVCA